MSKTTFKISVKAPCHEDWGGMSNTNDGRFCSSCEKEVIDFTKLSDDEVIAYIQKNAKHGGCGRFLNTQLETIIINFEENTFDFNIAFWKKFAAILMLCFAQQIFNAQVAFTQTPKKDSAIVKPICDNDVMIESPPMSYLDSLLKPIKEDSAVSLKDSIIVKDTTLENDTASVKLIEEKFTVGWASPTIKINPKTLKGLPISCDNMIVGYFISESINIPSIFEEKESPNSILYLPKKTEIKEENLPRYTANSRERKNPSKERKETNLPMIALLPDNKEKKQKKK